MGRMGRKGRRGKWLRRATCLLVLCLLPWESVAAVPSGSRAIEGGSAAVSVAAEGAGLTVTAVREGRNPEEAAPESRLTDGEEKTFTGASGEVLELHYELEPGRILAVSEEGDAVLSGDFVTEESAAAAEEGTERRIASSEEGKILVTFGESKSRILIESLPEGEAEGSAAVKEAAASKETASLVSGTWIAEDAPEADIRVTGRVLAAPKASSTGKITKHVRYDDGNLNLASVFQLSIDGYAYEGICADGTNYVTGEKGTGVRLKKLASSSVLTKLAYLADIDRWGKANYSNLDYQFALVNAARKLNGKSPSYERYDSRALTAKMIADAKAYKGTIPSSFRAYLATPTNGGQIILAWRMMPNGKLKLLKKTSGNEALLKDCAGAYSLAGATYEVTDASGKKVGMLTTKVDGTSNVLSLPEGTYRVKETAAPAGFAKDRESYEIHLSPGQTGTVSASDAPLFATISVFLEKRAEGMNHANPGDMSGAEFRISYYDTVGTIDQSEEAKRVWTLRPGKDEDGSYRAYLDDEHLVKGSDPLFRTEEGTVVLPRGTVTIEEVKAPKGYKRDTNVYTKVIDGEEGEAIYFNAGEPLSYTNQPLVPQIGTVARDFETEGKNAALGESVKLVDTIQYLELTPGETYIIRGTLMDAASGESLIRNNQPIRSEKEFVAKAEGDLGASGTVEVEFDYDTSERAGKSTVVFEELIYQGKVVAVHKDLTDGKQTVYHPQLSTTAHSELTGTNLGIPDEDEKIVDVVTYKNLEPGKEYRITGVLMDKETGKTYRTKDEREVTATKTFTAESSEGSVELTFAIDSSEIRGKTLVVFESLFEKEVKIASHEDLNDKNQSITYPGIETVLTDAAKRKTLQEAEEVELIDEIRYHGLVPGKEYVVSGTLRDKESGESVRNGEKLVSGTAHFVPESSEGTAEVRFTLNTEGLSGKKLVAFEELRDEEGRPVASHADLGSAEQTVSVEQSVIPKTGDGGGLVYQAVILLTSAILLVGIYIYRRLRRS